MYHWHDIDSERYSENFLNSISDFIKEKKKEYGPDLAQGFITDSCFATIKRHMLNYPQLVRPQFG